MRRGTPLFPCPIRGAATLITGGNRGIGYAAALALARRGGQAGY